ncbi:MAG: hypothetical protein ACR2HG_03755 [Pyrinomonadaceae bacterium]
MSNLSDIGFPTRGEQDVNEMIMHVLELTEPIRSPRGFYLKFSDASGAEVWLQGNFEQELIGFNPHFAGKSRRRVCLTKMIERDSSELDGGFHAWANPQNGATDSGDYPFVFDAPDFRTIDELNFPHVCEIQLTAFASNDFKIFADEKNYNDSQEDKSKFASKSFIPSGLFLPDDNATPIEPPRPIGIFAGEIKDFELKTNEISGEKFYWFLVGTFGGEIDVVADTKLILDEPQIGGIVRGQFWLSGKIIDLSIT